MVRRISFQKLEVGQVNRQGTQRSGYDDGKNSDAQDDIAGSETCSQGDHTTAAWTVALGR